MKKLKLWSLVAVLGVGNLTGCSGASQSPLMRQMASAPAEGLRKVAKKLPPERPNLNPQHV
jgi:hypothetical protein